MKLFWCHFVNEEWGAYVLAKTRGKAKSLFYNWYAGTNYTEYTLYIDVMCRVYRMADEPYLIEKELRNERERVIDDPDDPELKMLGVEYTTEDLLQEKPEKT